MAFDTKKFYETIEPLSLDNTPASDGMKIIDLYQKLEKELLDIAPTFQRKLVWKDKHKINFIKTILMNYPFPEIYIASQEIDITAKMAKEVVVDGKQRITTIRDYINGTGVFSRENAEIPLFEKLEVSAKKLFLNYKITVRDLKDVDDVIIKEIFRRINSTEYSLNKIELIHSEYGDSEFIYFSKQLVDSPQEINLENANFIIDPKDCNEIQSDMYAGWEVFSNTDQDRMFTLVFFMNVAITLLEGKYHSRNTPVNQYVERYNEEFSQAPIILEKIKNSFEVLRKLKLQPKSIFLGKSMFYNCLIEFSSLDLGKFNVDKLRSELVKVENLHIEYLNKQGLVISQEMQTFFEFARNSTNEKKAREIRASMLKECIAKAV